MQQDFDPSNPEVYFNKKKRKVYLHHVVDDYFSHKEMGNPSIGGQSLRSSRKTINRKDVFSSEGKKRKEKDHSTPFVTVEPKPTMFNLSSV